MKKILLVSFFVFLSNLSYGQLLKGRATGLAFKSKKNGNWSEWSDFKKVSSLITLDIPKYRIKIFSDEEQVYDIIKEYPSFKDADGDDNYRWQCMDKDGIKCDIRMLVLNSQKGRIQLYIDYANLMAVYNLVTLD